MHFDTGSNHMLSKLSFSLKLQITGFSNRQRLHDFDKILYPKDFFKNGPFNIIDLTLIF